MRAKFATGTLATAAAVALAACGTSAAETNGAGSGDDTERITGVRWIPETVTTDGKERAWPARSNGIEAYLKIDPGSTRGGGGDSGGFTGCNHLGADVEIDGDTLKFTGQASTEMACGDLEFEERFREILDSDPRFEVSNSGDTLTLHGDDGDSVTLARNGGGAGNGDG